MQSRREFLKTSAAAGALAVAGPFGGGMWPADPVATYTLRITFKGLCLFVVDETKKLRVLLPQTGSGHKHQLRYYNTAWNKKGETGSGADITVPGSANAVTLPFKNGLENFSTVWPGSKVVPSIASGSFDANALAARFTIPGGHIKDVCAWHGHWKADTVGKDIDMTPAIAWDCEVEVGKQPFPGAGLPAIQAAAGQTVGVEVRYVPKLEHGDAPTKPPKPKKDDVAPHFQYMKQLFSPKPSGDLRWQAEIGGETSCLFGITPFSCMVGGGDIGP